MRIDILADFPEAQNANIEIDYPKKIEVCIDVGILSRLTPVPENLVRIFVTSDPMEQYNKVILENKNCFTYVLTQSAELLALPNSGIFIGCGSFVNPNPDIIKKFAVSTVVTGRSGLPGHGLRHELYARRNEIKIPFDVYSGFWHGIPPNDPSVKFLAWPDRKDKIRVFDCMFHIVIDSYKRENMISEKLIDPLITKTIPIYWGCTNLSDFFNPQGIVEVDSVNDIIEKTNSLTPEFYYTSLAVVNENYEKALKCYRYEDILRDAIIKVLR